MDKIITISRQFGSGGREIGSIISEKLGIPFYDDESIKQAAAEESNINPVHFEEYDKNARNSFLYSIIRGIQQFNGMQGSNWSLEDSVYNSQAKVIRSLAENGPCVIIGRCADFILDQIPQVVKVFIYGDFNFRVKRAIEICEIEPDKAEEMVHARDKRRQNYYNYHADVKWGEMNNYHLCIDSSFCGIENAAELICNFVKSL